MYRSSTALMNCLDSKNERSIDKGWAKFGTMLLLSDRGSQCGSRAFRICQGQKAEPSHISSAWDHMAHG
jgi:hypothetical protein